MKYALNRLYKLITEDIEPTTYKDAGWPADQFNNWIAVATKEKRNVSCFLQSQTANATKKQALELQIQGYQAAVVQMLDQVFAYKTQYSDHPLQVVYEALLPILEQLLTDIENRHYRYFNFDEKVPDKCLQISQQELERRVKYVKKHLVKKGDDEGLVQLTLVPVMDLIKGKGREGNLLRTGNWRMLKSY